MALAISTSQHLRPSAIELLATLQQQIDASERGLQRFLPKNRKKKRSATTLKGLLSGDQKSHSFDSMRMLVAIGLLHWSDVLGNSASRSSAIPNVADSLAFSACALWPLVLIRHFPKNWEDDLIEFSSPQVAQLLLDARLALRKHNEHTVFPLFASELTKQIYSRGIYNIFEDLNDAERGAHAFASVLRLSSNKKIPKRLSTKDFFLWIGSAAVTGAIGNLFYDELKQVWSNIDITHAVSGEVSSGSGGSCDNAASLKHDPVAAGHAVSALAPAHSHSAQSTTADDLANGLSSLFDQD